MEKTAGEKLDCCVGLSCFRNAKRSGRGGEDEPVKADRRSALGEQTRSQRSPMPLAWVQGGWVGCGRPVLPGCIQSAVAGWGWGWAREGGGSFRSPNHCKEREQPVIALTQNQQQVQ